MLRRIQASNFRCLRDVDVKLDRSFHALVGPNGSGKSALLDVVAFFRDLMAEGLEAAISERTNNFQDLVWARSDKLFEFQLALEFDASWLFQETSTYEFVRFQLAVSEHADNGINATVWIDLLQEPAPAGRGYVFQAPPGDNLLVIEYGPGAPVRGRYIRTFSPPDAVRKAELYLESSIKTLFLESRVLRQASPPKGRLDGLSPNGSNLPWAIQRLQLADAPQFEAWLKHIQTTLPELRSLRIIEREDDRHAYLMIRFADGIEVPSWAVSDGTLRLLALTLVAYLPDAHTTYLLEEPENGLHPLAVETVYQSLSSVCDSQVLVATHSPVFLRCADLDEILCFYKTEEESTRIIPGHERISLADWRDVAGTDLICASEILGR